MRGRRAIPRLRGIVPCTGLPLNCRTHPLPRPWGGARSQGDNTAACDSSFGGLVTNERPRGGPASASLHALLVRSVRRSALGHTTAPLSALLQPHRAQPDPPTVGVERLEQCHERQQRLARVPQPRVSCDGSQLASRPASRAHSHLAASSLTTPAAHCLRHLRSRHHAAAPVLLPLPQPSASRFRHPLTEAVR